MFSKISRAAAPVFGRRSFSLLKARLSEVIPQKQAELKEIKQKYGDADLGKVTVDQVIGGMRNMFALLYDGSLLNPQTGITYRDYTIQEIKELLPRSPKGEEPLPEGLMWLLLTGEIPTELEYLDVAREFKERSQVGSDVIQFLNSLPKDLHPMTQLSQGVLFLQKDSKFAKAYQNGVKKGAYWESTYEDVMDLVAKLPTIAATIYRNVYKSGQLIRPESQLDWAGNYSHMLGYDKFEIMECLRGYLSIHSDHEGGNVSAHATHLVGSALSDPYLSYAAGINGLAGPLHGLANQEVLRWLIDLRSALGDNPSDDKVKDFVWSTLREGKVIPGYGHAVLRHTDPRYLHQRAFAEKYIKNDPLVDLCRQCYTIIPPILKELGKVKNPWPNVDAHSGVLLYHYGIREFEYYTVVFAVSRALGCGANQVWARAFGLPIERPGSITLRWIREKFDPEFKFQK